MLLENFLRAVRAHPQPHVSCDGSYIRESGLPSTAGSKIHAHRGRFHSAAASGPTSCSESSSASQYGIHAVPSAATSACVRASSQELSSTHKFPLTATLCVPRSCRPSCIPAPPIGIRRNPIWTGGFGRLVRVFRARARVVTEGDYLRPRAFAERASLTPQNDSGSAR